MNNPMSATSCSQSPPGPVDNRKSVLASIFWGDDQPGTATSWVAAEEGMISIITLISVLFFLILVGMLGNIGLIINQKIEVQNGADSIALSASQVQARGMNAVTASNHIIGELLALVVIHHAFGGDELDVPQAKDSPDDSQTQDDLNNAFDLATIVDADPPIDTSGDIKKDVNETPQAGATLFDSVIRLRRVLTWTYEAYAIGAILQQFQDVPYIGPILYAMGIIICMAAVVYEKKIYVERFILKGIEKVAAGVSSVKKGIVSLIDTLYQAQVSQVQSIPDHVDHARQDEADQALVTGATFPGQDPPAKLPVLPEPETLDRLEQSQLARATYPWVANWRIPIEELMWDWLRIARSANYYHHYSIHYTWQWVKQKKEDGVHLHVMEGLFDSDGANGNKGQEVWTQENGSGRADELFCLMGFARRKAPRLASSGVSQQSPTPLYKPQNPQGVVAYAQAMIYNANPQIGSRGSDYQALVGWDTLNWINDVPELPQIPDVNPERYTDIPDIHAGKDKPKMFVNWQTKLVPETRIREAANYLDGEIGAVVKKMIPVPRSFRTH